MRTQFKVWKAALAGSSLEEEAPVSYLQCSDHRFSSFLWFSDFNCCQQEPQPVKHHHWTSSRSWFEKYFYLIFWFQQLCGITLWHESVYFFLLPTNRSHYMIFFFPRLLHDILLLKDWFLSDHSFFYLNWKSGKSQIKLSGNCGALKPRVPKTASFLPACDQFIITPEEKEIMHSKREATGHHCAEMESKLCSSYLWNFPGTSIFAPVYLPGSGPTPNTCKHIKEITAFFRMLHKKEQQNPPKNSNPTAKTLHNALKMYFMRGKRAIIKLL